ncbi:MAG: hypothetical protein IH840_14910 [Candidatus Heimdallarchaeota archaeon]|nr:hypothetical protein [Candidatus Heimdallarchaeota archaeon]
MPAFTMGGTITISGVATDITTGTDEALTLAPNGSGDVIIDTDADTTLILNGGGDGVDSLILTDGDILISDGDLDLSGGDFNVVLDAADGVLIDGSSTTNTSTTGVLDINVTSNADQSSGINLSFSPTGSDIGNDHYGIFSSFTKTFNWAGFGTNTPDWYGIYSTISNTGEDIAASGSITHTIYGIYSTAANTGSVLSGSPLTRNTYGGYFSATGETDPDATSTAYGIYATAASADTNYAGYFAGDILIEDDDDFIYFVR